MKKYYSGVGARATPPYILDHIKDIANFLYDKKYILRSGGADGADKAFERNAFDMKDIFYAEDAIEEAMKIAGELHPRWDLCGKYARKLHGRNVFQVLGKDLKTPSKFVICWTVDGCKSNKDRSLKTGGTATAIGVAEKYGIPIFNLAIREDLDRILYGIGKDKEK